jgi:hypothetical protein
MIRATPTIGMSWMIGLHLAGKNETLHDRGKWASFRYALSMSHGYGISHRELDCGFMLALSAVPKTPSFLRRLSVKAAMPSLCFVFFFFFLLRLYAQLRNAGGGGTPLH